MSTPNVATVANNCKPSNKPSSEQIAEIEQTLRLFHSEPGSLFELRAIGRGKPPKCVRFTETMRAARQAAQWDASGQWGGIYFTPNPLALPPGSGKAATDADVRERRWLLIDVDPVRPAGTSSTDAQREAAKTVAGTIKGVLDQLGLVNPVTASSGNGYHICYPIQLANDAASCDLIKSFLCHLARQYDTAEAEVDGSVYNASRIWKLYGTTSRKGQPTDDSPHRRSKILESGTGWDEATAKTNTAKMRELVGRWDEAQRLRNGDVIRRAKAYLAKCKPSISGNGGHSALLFAARSMIRGFKLTEQQAYDLLASEYNPRCQPPWSERELLHKIDDAANKPFDKPDGWMLDVLSPQLLATTATTHQAPSVQAVTTNADDWNDPIPLDDDSAPPPFPLDVFTYHLRSVVEAVAKSTNTPPDYAACMALVAASGAIGRTRELKVKTGRYGKSILWIACVGKTGIGKTPAMDPFIEPFGELEERWAEEWRIANEAWKKRKDDEDRGPKPIQKRCMAQDFTTESLRPIHAENPRGLFLFRDELVGMFRSLGQHKKGLGDDRQKMLEMWNGRFPITDRLGDRNAENDGTRRGSRKICLSIAGGIQPDRIAGLDLFNGDGLGDRFLWTYPVQPPFAGEDFNSMSEGILHRLKAVFEPLFKFEMKRNDDGKPISDTIEFHDSGRKAWKSFTDEIAAKQNAKEIPESQDEMWAKLKIYVSNLALVLHTLRLIDGDIVEDAVDATSVQHAARLADYFAAHGCRVRSISGADRLTRPANEILDYLRRKRLTEFGVSDLTRNHVAKLTPEEVQGPLDKLAKYEFIRLVQPTVEKRGPGKPPKPKYVVNPRWIAQQNSPS